MTAIAVLTHIMDQETVSAKSCPALLNTEAIQVIVNRFFTVPEFKEMTVVAVFLLVRFSIADIRTTIAYTEREP